MKENKLMRLALIQMSDSGSVESNIEKSLNAMKEAASHGADLVLFPEVQLTEFFPQYPGQDVRKYQIPLDSDIIKMFEWELRVQAFQNSTIIAMCNRVGAEGDMDFSGESIVVDANGNVLAKADDKEQILYVDIELKAASAIRAVRPYTQLRRTEFYE